jgi:gliding motility-associated-like protein
MVNNYYHPFHDANWQVTDIVEITRSFRMIIFNRWGNKILETEKYSEGWDGTTMKGDQVDDGVYYAEIQYAQKYESDDYTFKTVQKIQVIR